MPKIALVNELHNLKRGGVYHSNEAMKAALESQGASVQIIAIQKRGKLFNWLISMAYLREFLFLPIWNRWQAKKIEKAGFDVAFYRCSTALFLIRRSRYKKVIYASSLLERQLGIFIKLDSPVYVKLIGLIIRPLLNLAESKSFKHSDRIIASKPIFESYIINHFKINPAKIKVLPQFINLETRKVAVNKSYDLLFVGRLSLPKNWPLVEEIARKTQYSIAAATPSTREETDLPGNITILNRVPYSEINKLYSSAKIFLMPSYTETGPRVTLEAMSCGLPIVASPDGSGGFFEDGVGGYIIKNNSAKDYIKAIDRLLGDEKLRQKMAAYNQAKAREYSADAMGPKYLKALSF